MQERITTAGIVIKDGKVLVAKRIKGGSLSEKWEFPGGKNRWGESLEDTLRREYEEELGVGIIFGREIFTYEFINKDTLYHLKACLLELQSEEFTLKVHTEVCYVDRNELLMLEMGNSDRQTALFLVENNLL